MVEAERSKVKISLRYVQPFVIEKNGKVYTYAYLRRPGYKRVRLPGLIGSVEFLAGYHAAMNGGDPVTVAAIVREKQQTIEVAIDRYIDEALPKRVPSEATRGRQTSTLKKFAELDGVGTAALSLLDSAFINRCIAEAPTVGVGRTWLITIREFCKWAVGEKLITTDPTAGIVIKLPKSDGHETWTEEQIAQFEARWPIGTRERLLFSLLLYTGQRCSDVRLLGPSSIMKGAFPITQQKTGAEVTIPVHAELAKAIEACKVVGLGYFLTTSTGKPLDQRDLNKWFRQACREAGLPDTCVPHGLRKACCRRLAQAGASTKLIAAVSGHQTLKEIERYTKAFDNEQGARDAFALLQAAKGGA